MITRLYPKGRLVLRGDDALALSRAAAEVAGQFEEIVIEVVASSAPKSLTAKERVLAALTFPATPKEIVGVTNIPAGTVRRCLRELLADGLVEQDVEHTLYRQVSHTVGLNPTPPTKPKGGLPRSAVHQFEQPEQPEQTPQKGDEEGILAMGEGVGGVPFCVHGERYVIKYLITESLVPGFLNYYRVKHKYQQGDKNINSEKLSLGDLKEKELTRLITENTIRGGTGGGDTFADRHIFDGEGWDHIRLGKYDGDDAADLAEAIAWLRGDEMPQNDGSTAETPPVLVEVGDLRPAQIGYQKGPLHEDLKAELQRLDCSDSKKFKASVADSLRRIGFVAETNRHTRWGRVGILARRGSYVVAIETDPRTVGGGMDRLSKIRADTKLVLLRQAVVEPERIEFEDELWWLDRAKASLYPVEALEALSVYRHKELTGQEVPNAIRERLRAEVRGLQRLLAQQKLGFAWLLDFVSWANGNPFWSGRAEKSYRYWYSLLQVVSNATARSQFDAHQTKNGLGHAQSEVKAAQQAAVAAKAAALDEGGVYRCQRGLFKVLGRTMSGHVKIEWADAEGRFGDMLTELQRTKRMKPDELMALQPVPVMPVSA